MELFNREEREDSEGKEDKKGKESENIENKIGEENFANLYKYIVQKYGFKDYNIIRKLREKLNDKKIPRKEWKKLYFVYDNLLKVS